MPKYRKISLSSYPRWSGCDGDDRFAVGTGFYVWKISDSMLKLVKPNLVVNIFKEKIWNWKILNIIKLLKRELDKLFNIKEWICIDNLTLV